MSPRPDKIGIQSNWGLGELVYRCAIHIALLPDKIGIQSNWSAEIGRIAFYRHIAPLERKTEGFTFNRKPMDFQRLTTWVLMISTFFFLTFGD